MTSELSKSLIKKHLETYKLSDEELKSLYQKHYKTTSSGSVGLGNVEPILETKKIKQLCQGKIHSKYIHISRNSNSILGFKHQNLQY
jgi:hypothetical protein